MSGGSCHHALIGLKQHVDYGLVGLGSAHKKEHLGIINADGLFYLLCSCFAVVVGAIARVLLKIGLGQPFKNLWMGTLCIIT